VYTADYFSNFGSLKSTETICSASRPKSNQHFSNFGSLKSTETAAGRGRDRGAGQFQQFRLVEEH